MKKNQVNAILVNQTKRRNIVFAFICAIIILFVFAVLFFSVYAEKNKKQYVSYGESSNIDYKVYLKDNNFFDGNFLDNNQQYIATLIDYISTDFEYKLNLDKSVEYKYYYRVEANVDVSDLDSRKSLYNKTHTLVKQKEFESKEISTTIKEHIDVDYNYYNDLIKSFVHIYDLEDYESTLTLNMYVNVIGSCEDFKNNKSEESVISLSIPLTTKTMAIDLSNNLVNSENEVIQCETVSQSTIVFVVLGMLFVVAAITLIFMAIRYEIKTRTAENIYEREMKKILNNYSSYIQTLNNDFDFSNYQMLKIDNFTDMLEIKDSTRQPILMKENEEKTGAYFVIPTNSKILYVYRLKVSDIEKEINKM